MKNKTIKFITGNIGKFTEASEILKNLEQLDIDLQEIQELDAKEVIKAKLQEALAKNSGPFIIEDTSLYISSLNGFPGPLIKWMLKSIGTKGIFDLISMQKDKSAKAITYIGYAESTEKIFFFEGSVDGEIVQEKGENGFGWDKIFLPKNSKKTFAEMTIDEKNHISMRKIALNKLKEFLENNC